MANRINNWREMLDLANKDLKPHKIEISASLIDADGTYDILIDNNGITETYASGYYEDELGDLINDAWSHARAKAKVKSETIYRYSEVKCTYHADGFWVVDAWKTNNPEEEGVVIAVINDVTGDCYAISDLDDNAKSVIAEKRKEIVPQRPEILAEIYNGMTDAEKDKFLRMTGNQ